MVTQRGIEDNPDKIQAILDMGPPTNINEVQRLTGRIATLSRFISKKSAEKDLPFFKTLRKVKNFEWTQECQQAFVELKAYLARYQGTLCTFTFSTTSQAVSSVLDAGASHLLAYYDSQLIVKQVNGEYEAKEEIIVQYLQQIEELNTKFKSFQLQQIPREENVKADSLSKLASALEDCKTRRITVQHLLQPRILLDIQPISSNNNDWRTPIICWINEGHLPRDRWEATKIKPRAIRFLMQGGMLYKKSFTHPLLRCLSQEEGLHVLKEIHDGYCGSHIGSWALANKALRDGYFWPIMKQDALLGKQVREMPKTCHPHTPTC
ncbi:UNVERIFIED_CONTAM: hypothetical protein Slati_1716200 [Sesamum latifolium]|uniref:RNase H type-1 domain-containing protein n=1 Tax=Sesamum latifolium TaxID=2727402 RepID=A0AAW2WWR8_9LAMI